MTQPLITAMMLVLASPALADRIEALPRTDHVTVFPQGADIAWVADIEAPGGTHEVLLAGLPEDLGPSSLRIAAEGARIGSFALQTARTLPGDEKDTAEVSTARAALVAAQDALVEFDSRIAAYRAEAAAWQERVQVVRDLMRSDSPTEPGEVQGRADEAGALISDYMARATQAQRDADLLANRRGDALRAVARAERALDAVEQNRDDHGSLLLTLEVTESPARLSLTGYTNAASWQPDYDLRLDRATGELRMERGVVVSQSSGADWQNATLTLSTARPSDQAAPTEVTSWFPRIAAREDVVSRRDMTMGMAPEIAFDEAAPAPVVEAATPRLMGMTVVYDYPARVTIRDQADALHLKLDEKTLRPDILAEAAPRFDSTAFLIAETTNTLDEPILPGEATFHVDGTMVGRDWLDLIVPGDEVRLGFGPLDGLTAELRVPEETEGDRGIIRRANERRLTETMILTNLTGADWPLRVVDRVPVSRQDDLKISWTAQPEPDDTDPDGRRGVLVWQAPIEAGETREITLTTTLTWPEDQMLLP